MTAAQDLSGASTEYQLKMELFTEYHRVVGAVTTTAIRTYGVLNHASQHLFLSRVSTSSMLKPQESPIESGLARLAKAAVVFAVPNEDPDNEQRLKIARVFNRGDLLQRQVLLGLGNYEVGGNLHLDAELNLEKVLLDRLEMFIGITNASILYLPNPTVRFAASTILINKHRVDFICAGTP